MSVATTEGNIDSLLKHYRATQGQAADLRINSLVTSQDVAANEQTKIPAAALLTVLIKLASQSQTTSMAIGCSSNTVRQLQEALKRADGNQTAAARLLGITRHTLLYRMEKFDLR